MFCKHLLVYYQFKSALSRKSAPLAFTSFRRPWTLLQLARKSALCILILNTVTWSLIALVHKFDCLVIECLKKVDICEILINMCLCPIMVCDGEELTI